MLRLEKRPQPSRGWTYGAPVLAVILTIIFGMGLFAILGKDPLIAIKTIFWDPIFGPFAHFYRPEIVKKAAPLVLIAVGLSFGFRAGIWNIGAEGQYIIGAICGAGVALAFYPMEARWLIFPLMIVVGLVGGLLWAMIPAILRVVFKTNEILVSLMLVYVAEVLIKAFSIGLLRNPEGFGMPGSRNLRQYPSAANLDLIPNTGFHWGGFSGAHGRGGGLYPIHPTSVWLQCASCRAKPAGGGICGGQCKSPRDLMYGDFGRACGACRIV